MAQGNIGTYQYQQRLVGDYAKAIRLVELLPGDYDAPLRCRLKCVPLNDKPAFDALSYCWGNEARSISLECDDSRLLITPNLAKAFRRFREADHLVTVWADAVCINQDDSEEKSHQVMLMEKIYKQAHSVKVWLGDEDSDRYGPAAFDLIRQLAKASDQIGGDVFDITIISPKVLSLGLPPVDDPVWQCLAVLLSRPWFYRVWIIQEVVLAKSAMLHWGSSTLAWDECRAGIEFALVSAATRLAAGAAPSGFSVSRATNLLAQLTHTQEAYLAHGEGFLDLLTLLRNHRGASATKAVDKVYALLGLSNTIDGKKARIEADYGLDIGTAYTRVAAEILRLSETLDLLSICKTSCSVASGQDYGVEGLPSWVPDWSIPATGGDMCFKTTSGKYFRPFDAGRTSEFPKSVSFVGNTLELQGVLFDQVAEVGDLMRSDEGADGSRTALGQLLADYARQISIWSNWRRISGYHTERRYPTGEDIQDVFIWTSHLGKLPGGETLQRAKDLDSRQHSHEKWLGVSRSLGLHSSSFLTATSVVATQILNPVPIDPDAFPSLSNSRSACTDMRRMIRTRGGYIGLASALVEPGDGVFVVKGSKVPLLLRPSGEDWRLVGDSYVHGIMQGEAFEESLCRRLCIS